MESIKSMIISINKNENLFIGDGAQKDDAKSNLLMTSS